MTSTVTVEMEDVLPEALEALEDDIEQYVKEWYEDNPGQDEAADYNKLDYSGRIHELVDGAVPIYTHDIKCAWFLHKSELEEAYENAGVGDNPMDSDGMAALYFWLWEKLCEHYEDNKDDWFEQYNVVEEEEEEDG